MGLQSTSLGDLLRRGVRLDAADAAAIVVQLCRAGTASYAPHRAALLDSVTLDENGRVEQFAAAPFSEAQRLDQAALVLRGLLPDPGAPCDTPAADALRRIARRVISAGSSPAYSSLDDFRADVQAFAPESPVDVVRAIVARSRRPEADVDGSLLPVVEVPVNEPLPWDLPGTSSSTGHDAAGEGAGWWPVAVLANEAVESPDAPLDLKLVGPPAELADAPPSRGPRLASPELRAAASSGGGRTPLVAGALAAAATLALFLAGTGVPTAREDTSTAREAQPAVDQGEATEVPDEPSSPASGDEPTVRPESPEAPASESAPVANEARDVAPGAAPRLHPLDVGIGPAFSPSFSPGGREVYFHAGYWGPSRLMRAGLVNEAGPDVWRILDDGARNYHPRVSPDGRFVAFDSDRDGTRRVYLLDLNEHTLRRVTGAGRAAAPSWSPDGRSLVVVRAEPNRPSVWNLWEVDLASGRERRLTSHPVGQTWSASWFPDGRRVAYSHEDRIVVLDLASGDAKVYPSPRPGALVRTPAVSPDGQRIVFQVRGHGVWLLDLATGRSERLLRDRTAEEFAWAPDGSRIAFHSRRDGNWRVWILDSIA